MVGGASRTRGAAPRAPVVARRGLPGPRARHRRAADDARPADPERGAPRSGRRRTQDVCGEPRHHHHDSAPDVDGASDGPLTDQAGRDRSRRSLLPRSGRALGLEERHGSARALRTWGFWDHLGPPMLDRGAPRLRRGAPNAGGWGAISGPPIKLGGHFGAPWTGAI